MDYRFDGNGLHRGAGNGSDLRPELSGLPAGLFAFGQLHQLQIHLDLPVQRHGLRPRGAMLRQSIFRTAWAASPAALISQPIAAKSPGKIIPQGTSLKNAPPEFATI